MTLCFGISITRVFKSVNIVIDLLQEIFYIQPNRLPKVFQLLENRQLSNFLEFITAFNFLSRGYFM